MSKLLKDIQKVAAGKPLTEEFKSDDGISTVPDVQFVKPGSDVDSTVSVDDTTTNRDTDKVAEDNKKEVVGKGKYKNPKALKSQKDLEEVKEETDADGEPVVEGKSWKDGEDNASKKVKFSDRKAARKAKHYDIEENVDVETDITAIFEGEELSEDFKARVGTIYRAALLSNCNRVIAEAHAALEADYNSYAEELAEEVEADKVAFRAELTEEADRHLSMVVEEWKEENKVALEQTARLQITESFMLGLKALFEDHYIELPEGKEDIFETMVSENTRLEDEINSVLNEKLELVDEIASLRKQLVLKEHVGNLSDNQAEKLRSLAEHVDFEDETTFAAKVEELKEAYFPKKKPAARSIEEDTTEIKTELFEDVQNDKTAPEVSAVAAVMSRFLQR